MIIEFVHLEDVLVTDYIGSQQFFPYIYIIITSLNYLNSVIVK